MTDTQKERRFEISRKVVDEDESKPVIIAQKYINMGLKCPHCNLYHKGKIKDIIATCPHCKKEFKKDISIEEKDEYDQETLKTAAWIMLKKFGQKPPRGKEVVLSVNDSHMTKAQFLIDLFSHLSIEKKDIKMGKATMNDGKQIDVWMITLTKNERAWYDEQQKHGEN